MSGEEEEEEEGGGRQEHCKCCPEEKEAGKPVINASCIMGSCLAA